MGKTQMNTRIDENVKQAGDAAFAAIGWTTSQVVQTVWEIAAIDHTFPALLKELAEKPKKSAALLHKEAMQAEIVRGANLVAEARKALGLPTPKKEKLDYRKMREEMFYERMAERGLL